MEKKNTNQLIFNPSLFSHTFVLALVFVPTRIATAQKNTTIPINVGVVLDMDSWVGKMGLSCISMTLSDFYASHDYYKTRIVLNKRDSKQDVVVAAAAALDLLKNVEVQAILGPVSSMQADFVIDLGDKAQVPIISFSATSPSLSSIRSPYFIRASQNDSSQVKALSSIVEAFGWSQVVPIYVDNEFGEGIIPSLTHALDKINTRVPYQSAIHPLATDEQILEQLYKLMTMQTSVFVVHMLPALAFKLFVKAKQLGMMSEGYAWITTDAITNELNSIEPSAIDSMEGVIGVRPYVPKTAELESFTNRWRFKFQQNNPSILNPQLNVFGLWAYDSATALAMAVEKLAGVSSIGFQKSNISVNSTDLETFGVSTNGPMLLEALLNTSIKGLSGDFNIVGGKLQSPAYQIVNVIANGAKEIAFWTTEKGIVRQLNFSDVNNEDTSKSNFGAIIWPGDTTTPPKGWVIPTNGRKLMIGVPVKGGFSEFVKVTRNRSTNTITVTGYCIEIFEAVVASLPYAVPHEYIPFETPDGNSAGTSNDLIYQVYLGKIDAVVGDITITANRSRYVDFSLPYAGPGLAMVIRVQDQKKDAWAFWKPLTWDLWLRIFIHFVVVGLLIWVLEHRINDEFRGPPLNQIGMILWFSFSTMVFAQKEKIVSNLARFVLIIWFLVVLILVQSYTASLTSTLTVQQLQPTGEELVQEKAYVGYQEGSYVLDVLIRMGFDESRLFAYNSPEELHQLFTKGNGNGGIVAAFDETPYMRLFIAKYCAKYTMVQTAYRTDGFGFVFSLGSPLVRDVSRAVLNVNDGDIAAAIEKKWILDTSYCQKSSTSRLDVDRFSGLFLIVEITVTLAFIIYLTMFLYEHWHVVIDPNYSSIWIKVKELARRFDNKDLSSHTFWNLETRIGATIDGDHREMTKVSPGPNNPRNPSTFSLQTSPAINVPPTSDMSSHTEHNISGELEIPSDENASSTHDGNLSQEITAVIEITSPLDHMQTT